MKPKRQEKATGKSQGKWTLGSALPGNLPSGEISVIIRCDWSMKDAKQESGEIKTVSPLEIISWKYIDSNIMSWQETIVSSIANLGISMIRSDRIIIKLIGVYSFGQLDKWKNNK